MYKNFLFIYSIYIYIVLKLLNYFFFQRIIKNYLLQLKYFIAILHPNKS
jgi:hypothetical protein